MALKIHVWVIVALWLSACPADVSTQGSCVRTSYTRRACTYGDDLCERGPLSRVVTTVAIRAGARVVVDLACLVQAFPNMKVWKLGHLTLEDFYEKFSC